MVSFTKGEGYGNDYVNSRTGKPILATNGWKNVDFLPEKHTDFLEGAIEEYINQ